MILGYLIAAATPLEAALLSVAGATIAGAGTALVNALANRSKSKADAAGVTASGAAELTTAALSLLRETTAANAELAERLKAERDECYSDRLVILELVESAGLETLAADVRRRLNRPPVTHRPTQEGPTP